MAAGITSYVERPRYLEIPLQANVDGNFNVGLSAGGVEHTCSLRRDLRHLDLDLDLNRSPTPVGFDTDHSATA
jgi:hypothetical protein